MPAWRELDRGPLLLLLHGTFGTPESAFGAWFEDPSFGRIVERYGRRVLAFAHPTLSATLAQNLDWLLAQLPARTQPVDIGRVCQVGTPNNGTALARDPLAWINAHVSALASLPAQYAFLTLEGALTLMRSVALGAEPGLPGIDTVLPDGHSITDVGVHGPGVRWYTIGAHYQPRAAPLEDEVHEIPTDLVVSSEDCHRPGAEVCDSLRLVGDAVHHHGYFFDRRVRESLSGWLCD
jgi:hypothetical protein